MFHFLLLYQGCTPLREARMGSFFALILWKLITRMRIVFCRGGLGFPLFGDDVWRGEPIWLSKGEQYDVPVELGDWKTRELLEAEGLGAASSMLLKEFLVGNSPYLH